MSGVSRWWMIGVVPVLLAVALLVTGCPQHRTNTPSGSAQGAKVLWSIQLEGDPWPWAVVDGNLLVWTYRFAQAGFLFPIKLESYNAESGKTNWSVPVRPWLWSTDAPWSFNAVLFEKVLGAWVKGNVARSLRLDTGQEAWSIPLCHGLARAGKWLVVASESQLLLLDPSTGKSHREISLTSPLAAPPLVRGQLLVGLQEDAHLVGVNLTTGKRIWRHKVGGAAGQPDRPLAAGDLVLLPHLPARSARGSTTAALLEARRISTGELVWRRSVPAPASGTKESPLSGLRVTGDLLMLLQNHKSCLQVLNLADGSPRFRRCGLHLSSAPVRHGKWLYVLGTDKHSAAALRQGKPWSTVDFPLLAVHTRTGRARAVVHPQSRRQHPVPLRAVRLQSGSQASGILYLLQRQRFLTAFRLEVE